MFNLINILIIHFFAHALIFSHHMLRKKEKKFGGVCNMQEKKHCDGKELICINVDKVYDWIVKEKSFDLSFPSGKEFLFTPTNMVPKDEYKFSGFKDATVKCEVTPDRHHPIVILGREDRPFCIDGKNVMLQQLNIRKNFVVTLTVTLADGTVLTSKSPEKEDFNSDLAFSRCEQVTLCAPEGTDIEITFTNLDCFVCTTGKLEGESFAPFNGGIKFSNLSISIDTCQSIQSTFPVTVEFLADFCEPREDFATACAPPMRPKQCSVVFPDDDHGHCCH